MVTHYVSTNGESMPLAFEQAILSGRPRDGGLYVPDRLPKIDLENLNKWKEYNFTELTFEILSLFIDRESVPASDLKDLIYESFCTFSHKKNIPSFQLRSKNNIYIQELFHGPTLSFKDIAMGFVVNLFEYFLKKRNQRATLVVATTGDTGPAAAFATIGKKHLDTWVFYPEDMITEEQRRQMTTINEPNVHAAGIKNCPDGADDLDKLIFDLFASNELRKRLNLSSVNSINWGRVMMQTVHYFYGYLQTVKNVGDPLTISVPSGAFGNLCAGSIARIMGLPIQHFIVANNRNACLHRIFSKGVFEKRDIIECPSSAIDILIPINFWRYMYFVTNHQSKLIRKWMREFEKNGIVEFGNSMHSRLKKGFLSTSISDKDTYNTIKKLYSQEGYLLDPHGAVAVAAAIKLERKTNSSRILCMATAHPSKFPSAIHDAIKNIDNNGQTTHPSIEAAKVKTENKYSFDFSNMHSHVPESMLEVANRYMKH